MTLQHGKTGNPNKKVANQNIKFANPNKNYEVFYQIFSYQNIK
jgi:hypothetical protein